jgi:hypothetical protein
LVENLKGRDLYEDLGMDGRIILKYMLKKMWWKFVGWVRLAQDWAQSSGLVNEVMDLIKNRENHE